MLSFCVYLRGIAVIYLFKAFCVYLRGIAVIYLFKELSLDIFTYYNLILILLYFSLTNFMFCEYIRTYNVICAKNKLSYQ